MTSYDDEPLVSVVIPTYERPQFLEGAIRTSLAQTYENTEIIVVDDGSSEQYADEIVSDFPEGVTCIQHDENKGPSAARNTGIREANGEYVAFLDDDDRWHETKISRQVEALERDHTAGLATCLVAAITPDGDLVHCETSAPSGDCSDKILIGNQIGTPSRVLVRRECFDDIGTFDESLPTKQDWDFYIRLCQEWNIVAVEDYICFRTVHESLSSSPKSAKRDNQVIVEKHEDLIRRNGCWEHTQAEIEERVGRAYLRQRDRRKARTHFREALRKDLTSRRVPLYLLTFTPQTVVEKLRTIKRGISIRRSDCSRKELLDKVVFGTTMGSNYGDD
jgi:glycosyltransferase involved in cell wall biosynthesis